jgi:prefoldin alpha subunit
VLGVVDITTLPAADLNKLRTSLTEDVQLISGNFGNLKLALSRYNQSLDSLQTISPDDNADAQVFVPLTSSMYVPGKLSNIKTVLVDIGTGYFAEKTISQAQEFLKNKIKLLQDNIEKVAGALAGKRRDLEAVRHKHTHTHTHTLYKTTLMHADSHLFIL